LIIADFADFPSGQITRVLLHDEFAATSFVTDFNTILSKKFIVFVVFNRGLGGF
jgi:hypothetical protein